MILFFLPSLGGGGAERVVTTVARHLHERGEPIELAVADASGPLRDALPATLPLHDLRAGRVARALLPLARLIRRHRPAAVLSTMDHANLVAIAATRLASRDTRVVVRLANTTSVGLRDETSLASRALPPLLRALYPFAHARIAVSEGVAVDGARLTGLARGRFDVVHNPVDLPALRDAARASARHPWLSQPGPPVVVAAGRLVPQKDFGTLLRAFATLRCGAEARLIVLGEGPQRAELEALARSLGVDEDVALPGFVREPYPELARAAVFCLSSRFEGFPNVLVEALACGAPVVSTRCPSGPDEILVGRDAEWLVPVGDPAALARAIERRLAAPRGGDHQRSIAARFALDAVGARYRAIALGE